VGPAKGALACSGGPQCRLGSAGRWRGQNAAAGDDSIAAAVVAETSLISEVSGGLRWNRCLRLLQLRWRLDCCGLGLRLAAIDGTLPSFAPW
jgi:hypothetical protein